MPVDKKAVVKALEEARKQSERRGFKQSIDLILNLKDIDLKKPENRINELVEFPTSPGGKASICVIATGDLALRAKEAGADGVVGKEELDALSKDKKAAKKLEKRFDFFIAEAQLMPSVGKSIGPVLGPRGKMPTPVPPTAPIDAMMERYRKMSRVMVRSQLNSQIRVGTEEMSDEQIAENVQAVMAKLEGKLEKGSRNIRSVLVKTTMGAPIKVAL